MQVEAVTAAKARLLHNAGLTSLERVATSDEGTIADALAAGVKLRKTANAAAANVRVGRTGATGTNALVARDAKLILQGTIPL